MKIEAIIFDCDGTLVDSERVGNEVICECVGELGLELSLPEAIREFAGRKMADTIAIIEAKMGSPLPADFLPMLRERMAKAFEERLQPMPGAHELLQALHLPICVASNGPQEKMQTSLRVTGLLPYFKNRIYSAYDCDRWKPDPGLFQYAAEQLGVETRACAVVEDSIHGIRAGLAAGMQVFGYNFEVDPVEVPNGRIRRLRRMEDLLESLE